MTHERDARPCPECGSSSVRRERPRGERLFDKVLGVTALVITFFAAEGGLAPWIWVPLGTLGIVALMYAFAGGASTPAVICEECRHKWRPRRETDPPPRK